MTVFIMLIKQCAKIERGFKKMFNSIYSCRKVYIYIYQQNSGKKIFTFFVPAKNYTMTLLL